MTPTIRLIIAGSRTVDPTDEDIDRAVIGLVAIENGLEVAAVTLRYAVDHILEVIGGRARRGADTAGERWALARGIPFHPEPVTQEDYDTHGSYLGPKMRNRRMAMRATHLLAYWDGSSGGTADMVCRMVARHLPAIVIPMRRRPVEKRRRVEPRGL